LGPKAPKGVNYWALKGEEGEEEREKTTTTGDGRTMINCNVYGLHTCCTSKTYKLLETTTYFDYCRSSIIITIVSNRSYNESI
jgi:hypothetical protein